MLAVKMLELGHKSENKICSMHGYLKIYIMLIEDIFLQLQILLFTSTNIYQTTSDITEIQV